MTYSVASRLILDKTNSVRGINVERFGQELQYFASGEVILSAGAIGTPQGQDSTAKPTIAFSKFDLPFSCYYLQR